ncbi:DUF1232 domain-containing protein [Siminovitchia acidinfaciens]|uniref:DUF1232 domain-containing protein n=1 Tax=Siminovitchia acidinfaciens TaxID=2321395 RepID=A0A429Y8F7_9BACI|nr:YkvA family protein [Siminovitchia acidinfaciens]RST77690.1 DUF1232 domain-containing protein [Siminovitchia acidinfaciens]
MTHNFRKLKQYISILYLAYRDPRVPGYAKCVAICVVAYAISPIDLIPDFIPILGYLDDLIIVPIGIINALLLIPRTIIEEYRNKAEENGQIEKPRNWIIGTFFIAAWIICFVWLTLMVHQIWKVN